MTLPHPSGKGSYFDVLRSRLTDEEFRELGGTELRPGLPTGSLFWMAESGTLPSGKLMPVAVGDFVAARLADVRPVTEVTNAHAHGAMNILTSAVASGSDRKAWAGRTGLARDSAARRGNRPSGARRAGGCRCLRRWAIFRRPRLGALLEPDELWLNISTGSQVSLPRSRPELGPFQTRPFFDGRYLITVTTIPAGRASTRWSSCSASWPCAEGHVLADPWSYISRAAAAASDPVMQANIAFFAGAMGDRGSLSRHARRRDDRWSFVSGRVSQYGRQLPRVRRPADAFAQLAAVGVSRADLCRRWMCCGS